MKKRGGTMNYDKVDILFNIVETFFLYVVHVFKMDQK